MNKIFTEENCKELANKTKKCINSLVIKEMQNKTTKRSNF